MQLIHEKGAHRYHLSGSQCGTDLSADVGNIVVSERLIGRQGQNRFAEPFGDWKLTFATSQ